MTNDIQDEETSTEKKDEKETSKANKWESVYNSWKEAAKEEAEIFSKLKLPEALKRAGALAGLFALSGFLYIFLPIMMLVIGFSVLSGALETDSIFGMIWGVIFALAMFFGFGGLVLDFFESTEEK